MVMPLAEENQCPLHILSPVNISGGVSLVISSHSRGPLMWKWPTLNVRACILLFNVAHVNGVYAVCVWPVFCAECFLMKEYVHEHLNSGCIGFDATLGVGAWRDG
jgi:hypothetical protein